MTTLDQILSRGEKPFCTYGPHRGVIIPGIGPVARNTEKHLAACIYGRDCKHLVGIPVVETKPEPSTEDIEYWLAFFGEV